MKMVKLTAVGACIAVVALIASEAAVAQSKPPPRYTGPIRPTIHRTMANGYSVNLGYVDSMRMQSINAYTSVATGFGAMGQSFLAFQEVYYDPSSKVCTPDPTLGQVCGYTRSTFILAAGDIPLGDLVVTANTAHLHTDFANNPNMYFSECVSDSVANTFDCVDKTPVPTIIDVSWVKTSDFYYLNRGYSEQKIGPELIKIHSDSQVYSSLESGTILGMPVGPGASGVFGTSNTLTMDRIWQP